MTSSNKYHVLIPALCLAFLANVTEASGRIKRELKFPKGGSLVAGVVLASLLPKGPTDGLAHVLEFDLGFPFPEKFSIGGTKPDRKFWNKSKNRHKRSLKEEQRENLLLKLQNALTRVGLNGFSCVSRLQCELGSLSQADSLLERLLLILFTPGSSTEEKECTKHFSTCQVSLLQIILHSEQISEQTALRLNK